MGEGSEFGLLIGEISPKGRSNWNWELFWFWLSNWLDWNEWIGVNEFEEQQSPLEDDEGEFCYN